VAPGDAKAIADCVRDMARDRPKLLSMGLAAMERFRIHPTWDNTGEAVRGFLRKMVNRRTNHSLRRGDPCST
ncbi:glycosyltransferase, partial [Thermodesulfobacteriota bacterium]